MISIHATAIDFIQRFMGEDVSNGEVIKGFFSQSGLDIWVVKQYPNVAPAVCNTISLVARPYFEHRDTPVYVVLCRDTLFITGSSDSSISFVKPSRLGNQPQIILDLPHAGTKPPACIEGLLSESVIVDQSVCSSNPYTIWNQSDVGVLEVAGSIWRNSFQVSCGSAVLTNLLISNGNRAPAQMGRTNQVYNTHTYRGTSLYKDQQQPTVEIKRTLKENHDLSIAVAGACRAAVYRVNSHYSTICLELHSYSTYSHEILDALFSPTINGLNLAKFAPQNEGLGTKALLNYLHNIYDPESYQELVRPLISVLDVANANNPDQYSTVNQAEMNAFVDPFLKTIYEAADSLAINLNDWQPSRPDVYGVVNSILERLNAVIKQADNYLGINDYSAITRRINTVTIEYNRVLVTSDEASNMLTNQIDFEQRCQLVGKAFVAGLNKMQNLIQQRTKIN